MYTIPVGLYILLILHFWFFQGIDADCLQLLIQYVESGSYAIPNENILALLQTSAMLQVSCYPISCFDIINLVDIYFMLL